MRYETARNFRAALDARLKPLATPDDQRELVRMRKQIAFERFLARLLTTAPDAWIVKGGAALQYRLGSGSRLTRDLDLVLPTGADFASDAIAEALAVDMGDFFTFALQGAANLDHGTEGASRRFHIRSSLDGRQFETFIVDVGFAEPSALPTETIAGNDFLDFAGVERITMPVIAIEIHLAEKIHAYCRTYAGNRQNTRVKDLIDIVLIGETQELRAGNVRLAIDHTFESRGTHPIPTKLEAPPAAWAVPYRELARSVAIEPDIAAGHAFASALIEPLLGGALAPDAMWDTSTRRWATRP